MNINYNVSGSDRKRLVAAIAEYNGEKPKYLGAPSFAYQVGTIHISVDGTVTIEELGEAAPLIRFLREKGFQAEDPLADCVADGDDDATAEDSSEDETSGVCISMPRSIFTDSAMENLKAIVAAKGNLIKKALGADALPIEVTEHKVSFPWFPAEYGADELNTYGQFVSKLCDMARNQKRINAREKEVDNEKYAFRCFLLRLGFIGDEYKVARKILLRNFFGNCAFKSGSKSASSTQVEEALADERLILEINGVDDVAEALEEEQFLQELNASFAEEVQE